MNLTLQSIKLQRRQTSTTLKIGIYLQKVNLTIHTSVDPSGRENAWVPIGTFGEMDL